jgi:hypothetical protein
MNNNYNNCPEFFNQIPVIKLYDPLADFLGASENGLVEFSYFDVVKAAGHSCATVAGAYLMTYKALEKLFLETIPIRGSIKIEFKNSVSEGVTGVISNVISQITGATKDTGFKGINGKFVRYSLIDYNVPLKGLIRFTRVDTGETVELDYNPAVVPPTEKQQFLMQQIMTNQANSEDKEEFKELWQERVRRIMIENFNNANLLTLIGE